MDKFNYVNRILDFAIAEEVEANQFYLGLAHRANNPEIRRAC